MNQSSNMLPGKTGLAENGRKVRQKIGGKCAEHRWKMGRSINMWADKQQMGTMFEFITRMGYHFRQKIGRK